MQEVLEAMGDVVNDDAEVGAGKLAPGVATAGYGWICRSTRAPPRLHC